tara:strand:+ start:5454 stop:5627 length:174 start_codon:yes stop_codon:yes gene_type:complete
MSIKELIENLKQPAQVGWARGLTRSVLLTATLLPGEREALQIALDASPSPNPPTKPW